MNKFSILPFDDYDEFKCKLLHWSSYFDTFTFLDSNGHSDKYSKYDFILGVDALDKFSGDGDIQDWVGNDFVFSYISYYSENNTDPTIAFEPVLWYKARYVIYGKNNRIYINRNLLEAQEISDMIEKVEVEVKKYLSKGYIFSPKTQYEDYINTVENIKEKILEGQFYEMNYCIEYYCNNIDIEPISAFCHINTIAQSPMSALVKQGDKYALSFSPERFMALRGVMMIAQPIKGTIKREQSDEVKDEVLKTELQNSLKDKSENYMIVDLMRNDMTPYAKVGSIKVMELCEIYSFKWVHQMISTIEAKLKITKDKYKALKFCLPPGSMTGAPKIEVMKNIDELEDSDRGLYAGNIGYIDADGDFDFSVVIRTLMYNDKAKIASIHTGGAITLLSDADKEYQECEVKVGGILRHL